MKRTAQLGRARAITLLLVAIVVVAAIVVGSGLLRDTPSSRADSAITTDKPESSPTGPPPLRAVVVAQWGEERYLIYLPLYVAMEAGIFKKHGLDVTIKYSGNDDTTFAAVVGGSALFGIGDPVFAAIAQERGYPARVIGTIVNGVAIWGVTKTAALPVITERDQLAGLRIGTFPSPSTNYTLMNQLVQSVGSQRRPPKIVQAPIGSQLALLDSGTADIAMVLEPGASLAEAQGYRVVYSSPRFHGEFAFTGITTTEAVLKANADVARRFVAAIEEGLVAAHNDRNVAINVGKKLFPQLAAGVVERAVDRMMTEGTYPAHVAVSDQAWQNALRTRSAVGDLKTAQPTAQTVDNTYALDAQRRR